MNLDEQIAILQAAKEGEPIQCRARTSLMSWYDNHEQQFNFGIYEYRIKPMDQKVKLFLRAPWKGLPPVGMPCNCEATFNAEGELIRVELL